MKKGLVSVIMPVYNGFPDIQLSIKSLLSQTYINWECIVVNDGSSDGTCDYLDSLEDHRFVVHHFAENKGRPYARQKGLDLATGEFIAMLDADDLYHPKKLEYQVKLMNDNPDVYLVGGGLCSYGKNVDFIRIRGKGDGKIKLFNDKFGFVATHAPSMLRREHAMKFKYNLELMLGQDIDYLRRYLFSKKYVIMSQVVYYYSEFDAVSKKKIRKAYKIYIRKFLIDKEYINAFIVALKYAYSWTIYPFVNINTILEKRGVEPTELEYDDFKKYCRSQIVNV